MSCSPTFELSKKVHADFGQNKNHTGSLKNVLRVKSDELVVTSPKSDERGSISKPWKRGGLSPLTDTTSHYVSPAGEAIWGEYTPHKPLVNDKGEIRPLQSPAFGNQVREKVLAEFKEYVENIELENDKSVEKVTERKESTTPRENPETFYKTSTQKLYEGAEWDKRIHHHHKAAPVFLGGKNYFAKRQTKYFHDKADIWQKIGATSWDSIQSRDGGYRINRPVNYCSFSKNFQQIPNYTGFMSGFGEADIPKEKFQPLTVLRTNKPRYTDISRKPGIPGYTGCTLALKSTDVLSQEKLPRMEVTASTYIPISLDKSRSFHNRSLHPHQGPLSRMVSLCHPFNPFNQVKYSIGQASSGHKAGAQLGFFQGREGTLVG